MFSCPNRFTATRTTINKREGRDSTRRYAQLFFFIFSYSSSVLLQVFNMFSSTWRGFVVHTYPHPSLARTRDRGALLPTLQIVYDTKRSDALLVPLFCFRPGVQGLFSFFSFSKSTNYFLQLGYDATRRDILLVLFFLGQG